MASVNGKKMIDTWAISSQADAKAPEGSTTRESILKPEVVRLYEDGKTIRQVAEIVSVPSRTVARWLKKSGTEMRRPGQNVKHSKIENRDFLFDEYETQKKSAERIAIEHGVRPELILRMLKRAGIAVRSTNKGRKFDPEMHKRHSDWLKGRFVGEKNPNWRGGNVDPNARLRASYQSKEWSKAVRLRDGQCVDCGSKGRLHAHHVKPWKNHPELRFDVSNGITLCVNCHQKAHGFKFPDWVTEKSPRVQGIPLG